MPNFSFVQYKGSSTGSTSQTFTSPNTVGNIIIAFIDGDGGSLTLDTQGPSSKVTDSQGNQYYCIQAEPDPGLFEFMIYVAVQVKAGSNTVTYNGSGLYNLVIAEYASVSPSYFICPGGAVVPDSTGDVNNTETEFGGGTGPTFTSSGECMIVWGIGVGAAPVTAATGIIRAQFSGYALEYFAFGDEDLPSVSSYSNAILTPTQPYGVRASVFLNLSGSCTGIVPPLSISCASPPNGVTGVSYSHTFPAFGGTSPYTFSISVGSLPTGLTLNTSTGVVSGTPSGSGTSPFTIKVTDSLSNIASVPCSITINDAISIACGSPPNGTVGTSYTHTFPVTGGTGPFVYSVFSGSLPGGLTLNTSTGVVSGTPTTVGSSSFVIEVTDSIPNSALTPTCSISINPAGLAGNCASPPVGFISLYYTHTLAASGGVPPYSFSLISGSLPPGLSLDDATGVISGTPSNIRIIGFKLFPFTFQVTDSNGSTVNVSCTIRIQNYLAGLPCN